MFVAGGISVVAGGFVAAVTGPTEWEHGSWVSAFLVLVGGVAQIGIAAGQAHLVDTSMTRRFGSVQCILWNTACAIVVAGTLLSSPATVSIGSALLMAALGMSVYAISRSSGRHPQLLVLYRALLTVLLVSIPIGITLSWTRH